MITKAASSHKSGFTLTELIVVTVFVFALMAGFLPLIHNRYVVSRDGVARAKGRDIYIAITGANAEREPLGLPPVWPSDLIYTNKITGYVDDRNFNNSTDYFKWLFDEANLGTRKRSPIVGDAYFDYSKLSGAGVPQCLNGRLTARCNMWTVAKNISNETPDCVPILATRNIDASSFASKVSENDLRRTLRFKSWWCKPYRNIMGYVLYKNGSYRFFSKKNTTYFSIYKKQYFDVTEGITGLSLKYLTPESEVSLE